MLLLVLVLSQHVITDIAMVESMNDSRTKLESSNTVPIVLTDTEMTAIGSQGQVGINFFPAFLSTKQGQLLFLVGALFSFHFLTRGGAKVGPTVNTKLVPIPIPESLGSTLDSVGSSISEFAAELVNLDEAGILGLSDTALATIITAAREAIVIERYIVPGMFLCSSMNYALEEGEFKVPDSKSRNVVQSNLEHIILADFKEIIDPKWIFIKKNKFSPRLFSFWSLDKNREIAAAAIESKTASIGTVSIPSLVNENCDTEPSGRYIPRVDWDDVFSPCVTPGGAKEKCDIPDEMVIVKEMFYQYYAAASDRYLYHSAKKAVLTATAMWELLKDVKDEDLTNCVKSAAMIGALYRSVGLIIRSAYITNHQQEALPLLVHGSYNEDMELFSILILLMIHRTIVRHTSATVRHLEAVMAITILAMKRVKGEYLQKSDIVGLLKLFLGIDDLPEDDSSIIYGFHVGIIRYVRHYWMDDRIPFSPLPSTNQFINIFEIDYQLLLRWIQQHRKLSCHCEDFVTTKPTDNDLISIDCGIEAETNTANMKAIISCCGEGYLSYAEDGSQKQVATMDFQCDSSSKTWKEVSSMKELSTYRFTECAVPQCGDLGGLETHKGSPEVRCSTTASCAGRTGQILVQCMWNAKEQKCIWPPDSKLSECPAN